MKRLAMFVVWTAIVMYSFVGLTGILLGPYELAPFLSPEATDPTVYNQLRFFKALELGMGVAFFLLRRRVASDPFAQRFIAFVLWATPAARIASMVSDGLPVLSFRLLAGVEIAGAFVFTMWVVLAQGTARRDARAA